jgi:hypothetical protein
MWALWQIVWRMLRHPTVGMPTPPFLAACASAQAAVQAASGVALGQRWPQDGPLLPLAPIHAPWIRPQG